MQIWPPRSLGKLSEALWLLGGWGNGKISIAVVVVWMLVTSHLNLIFLPTFFPYSFLRPSSGSQNVPHILASEKANRAPVGFNQWKRLTKAGVLKVWSPGFLLDFFVKIRLISWTAYNHSPVIWLPWFVFTAFKARRLRRSYSEII